MRLACEPAERRPEEPTVQRNEPATASAARAIKAAHSSAGASDPATKAAGLP